MSNRAFLNPNLKVETQNAQNFRSCSFSGKKTDRRFSARAKKILKQLETQAYANGHMKYTKPIFTALLPFVFLSGCGKPDSPEHSLHETALQADNCAKCAICIKSPDISLHEAALQGNLEAVQQHIVAGSDLDEKDPESGASPLITAAAFGKVEIAKALIAAGADVNHRQTDGGTPLHTAAFLCHSEIVEALLNHGADKNARNNNGITALESVAGSFDEVIWIYVLLEKVLGPMGLNLDYERIQADRPKIAEMLRYAQLQTHP